MIRREGIADSYCVSVTGGGGYYRSTLFSLCLILLTAVPGFAQVGTQASIFGTVTDPSGANVTGAAVTATNVSTNAVNKAVTDQEGNVSLLALPIGAYRITVQAPGFKRWENSTIELAVGDQWRLAPVLQVGAISETVTVSNSGEAVQTEKANVETVVQWH